LHRQVEGSDVVNNPSEATQFYNDRGNGHHIFFYIILNESSCHIVAGPSVIFFIVGVRNEGGRSSLAWFGRIFGTAESQAEQFGDFLCQSSSISLRQTLAHLCKFTTKFSSESTILLSNGEKGLEN
jgi:hypothetical protein